MTISPELRRALDESKGEPLRIEDPENRAAYVVVDADAYARLRAGPEPKPSGDSAATRVPEGISLAREAFVRDLPAMLGDRRLVGRWVLYYRERRIAFADRERERIERVIALGIPGDDYGTFVVRERSREPEDVDFPTSWR